MDNNNNNQSPETDDQHIGVNLTEVPITDENIALNVIISFLVHAQKKGIFTFDESAKIWECIQVFQKPNPN